MKKEWKNLPAKRRLILIVLLMIALQALLYLTVELPRSSGEVPLGGVAATGLLLMTGTGFVRYYRRWTGELAEESQPVRGYKGIRLVVKCTAAAIVGAYLLLLAFPEVLFRHRMAYRAFVVRADEPMVPEMQAIIDEARRLLAASPAYDSTVTQTVFLSNSRAKFALFAGTSFGAFAIRSPIKGHIFVADAFPKANLAMSRGGQNNQRSLVSVIVHEATHNFLRRLPAGRGLPTWKEEGYAEYVAKEGSYDHQEGVRRLVSGASDPSNAFRYFKYRMVVTYLLEEKGVPLEEFLKHPYDPALLRAEAIHWLSQRDSFSAVTFPVATYSPPDVLPTADGSL